MEALWSRISPKTWRWLLLAGIAVLTLIATYAAIRYRMLALFALPLAGVMFLQVLHNYKPVFFLLIFSIPASYQMELSAGGLAIDMPSEPLMLLFLVIFLFNVVSGRHFQRKSRIYPFHLLIFLILFWTFFTTITSEVPARSFKFFLAKLWYIAAFVYMGERILASPKDVRRIFWAFFFPLVILAIVFTIRHSLVGFAFGEAHLIAHPIFPNGVIYSATLALFVPWCWYARTWYSPKSLEWYLIIFGMLMVILEILLSFKRGAFIATAVLPFVYLLINRKVLDKLVLGGVVVAALLVFYLVQDNTFYRFAPNYQSTVWHGDDFSAHLEATFQGTEISGMERFYRWVAAKNIIADMPWVGSGPSTFNQVYKRYADEAFRTYVSDNEEQSTTHNYFLMTFSEQGFVGGLLFVGLVIYMLVKGIRLSYVITDPTRRSIVLLAVLSLTTILLHSLLNEMIEVDKIGPMFWIALLLIHKSEVWEGESVLHGGTKR